MRLTRLTTALSAVAALTLTLAMSLAATAPAAQAAPSTTYVTRGQYVEMLLQANGVQPDSSAAQSFSDVPPSNPYYGWVEAAYKDGITTGLTAPANGKMGVFGVRQDLNRAEAAAFDLRAYSPALAYYIIPNSRKTVNGDAYIPNQSGYTKGFTDNAQIPTALLWDVYTATEDGLMFGFPDHTFRPMDPLTRAQAAHLIQQLQAVLAVSNTGPIQWRFFLGASVPYDGVPDDTWSITQAESISAHMADVMAAIVKDEPFTSVAQYADPSSATAVDQQFNQLETYFQNNDTFPGDYWRILGVSSVATQANRYGGGIGTAPYVTVPALVIQLVNKSTGQPVTPPTQHLLSVSGGGPAYSSVVTMQFAMAFTQSGQMQFIDYRSYKLAGFFVNPTEAQNQIEAVELGTGAPTWLSLGAAIAVRGQ